jgi:ribulose-5-phosphate 4-epimerase/fuculose-1-phosphate aldolase
LVRDLGDNAMTLRHHGALPSGRTVGDAFEMYYLEQACRLQVAATQGGQKVVVPTDSVAEHAAGSSRASRATASVREPPSSGRVDRESPDYAT